MVDDTPRHIGSANEVRSAAMTTANSAAMTTANTAAAALFDAVEDSDSSASSDMLQTSQHADGLLPAPVFVENSFANLSRVGGLESSRNDFVPESDSDNDDDDKGHEADAESLGKALVEETQAYDDDDDIGDILVNSTIKADDTPQQMNISNKTPANDVITNGTMQSSGCDLSAQCCSITQFELIDGTGIPLEVVSQLGYTLQLCWKLLTCHASQSNITSMSTQVIQRILERRRCR